MSDTYRKAIVALEQELEALDERRGDIQKAIDTLRPFLGATEVRPRPRGVKPRPTSPTRRLPAAAPGAPAAAAPPPGTAIVQARDRAICDALGRGPKTVGQLLEVMPHEPGQSDDRRRDALRNALTRLKLKKQIALNPAGGWRLA